MRVALVIEYDGARYHGFQYQANATSIQGELEKALKQFTGESVRVKGAGRTDSGVHAKGQVAAFDISEEYLLSTINKAMNFHLPQDIVVKEAYRVNEEFDPRRHATSREYRYTLLNRPTPSPLVGRFSHHIEQPLCVDDMREAAKHLEGQQSFASFSGPLRGRYGYIRNVYKANVHKEDEEVLFDVEANAFLPQQVRRMTGALVQVGLKRITVEKFMDLLLQRGEGAANTALPAQGVCLMKVNYRDFPPKAGE